MSIYIPENYVTNMQGFVCLGCATVTIAATITEEAKQRLVVVTEWDNSIIAIWHNFPLPDYATMYTGAVSVSVDTFVHVLDAGNEVIDESWGVYSGSLPISTAENLKQFCFSPNGLHAVSVATQYTTTQLLFNHTDETVGFSETVLLDNDTSDIAETITTQTSFTETPIPEQYAALLETITRSNSFRSRYVAAASVDDDGAVTFIYNDDSGVLTYIEKNDLVQYGTIPNDTGVNQVIISFSRADDVPRNLGNGIMGTSYRWMRPYEDSTFVEYGTALDFTDLLGNHVTLSMPNDSRSTSYIYFADPGTKVQVTTSDTEYTGLTYEMTMPVTGYLLSEWSTGGDGKPGLVTTDRNGGYIAIVVPPGDPMPLFDRVITRTYSISVAKSMYIKTLFERGLCNSAPIESSVVSVDTWRPATDAHTYDLAYTHGLGGDYRFYAHHLPTEQVIIVKEYFDNQVNVSYSGRTTKDNVSTAVDVSTEAVLGNITVFQTTDTKNAGSAFIGETPTMTYTAVQPTSLARMLYNEKHDLYLICAKEGFFRFGTTKAITETIKLLDSKAVSDLSEVGLSAGYA